VEKRLEPFAQLAAVFILVAGCYLVLRPFLAAMLLASVMSISTWPLYLWALRRMQGRKNLAALTMTISLTLLLILPLVLVAYNLAANVSALYEFLKQAAEAGSLAPPAWLKDLPLAGESLDNYWNQILTDREEMVALMKNLVEPARNFLLASGILLGQGVMEMSMSAFISFFLFRDGAALADFFHAAISRVSGANAGNVIDTIKNTVQGVMYGLLGTALAQGSLATIGFAIAGVPAALMLGVATAMLSLIPVGPPLIWIGAAIWLFFHGDVGWGIFMLLWGFFLVSSVDNVIKPLLISRISNLPFILGLLGVMGGVLAFGFVGIFIGPVLLAVGFSLLQEWIARDSTR
jgi:predicted PurR-regulated permease PerM